MVIKNIFVGIIVAVGAALITWLAIESRESLTDLEMKKIAKKIVNEDDFKELLLLEFKLDGGFVGKDGKSGISIPQQNDNNWCSDFSDGYQICWGYATLTGSDHARSFDFTYVNQFSEAPVVTHGISARGEGYMFSVYSHKVTTHKFTGRLAESYSHRNSDTPVVMNYIAIGKK